MPQAPVLPRLPAPRPPAPLPLRPLGLAPASITPPPSRTHLPQRLARPAAPPRLNVAMVSTHAPRRCGIATFTADLARAVTQADPDINVAWAAIDDPLATHTYGPEVRWRIRQRSAATYRDAAIAINASDIDVVSVQHEFGLYGIWGDTFEDHLRAFLEPLAKPLVVTLHTVLPDPSPSVLQAVRLIGDRSQALMAMATRARQLLEDTYGIDPAKLHVIPHGVPTTAPTGGPPDHLIDHGVASPTREPHREVMRGAVVNATSATTNPTTSPDTEAVKARLDLRGRRVISTFGFVDPRKGLEYMVDAMSHVVRRHPDALYLILGKTHPDLVRFAGEQYRRSLIDLVQVRGLQGHVRFVDEFLSQDEIRDYLLASDIYVTPYLDPDQITSGTLSYALGAGKAIVSTPYAHAIEALDGDRGMLVTFRSAPALASAVTRILDSDALRTTLERNAARYGSHMAWPLIGRSVSRLYRSVAEAPRLAPPLPLANAT